MIKPLSRVVVIDDDNFKSIYYVDHVGNFVAGLLNGDKIFFKNIKSIRLASECEIKEGKIINGNNP